MTVTYPEAVTAQGNESYYWVETLAVPSAPTVAELTAGVPIACAMYDGGAVTGETNKGEAPRRVCDDRIREKSGATKYTMADIQYLYNPQGGPAHASNAVKEAMEKGAAGYIVERLGLHAKTTALAATQIVNIFPVLLGEQNRTKTGDRSDEFAEFSITQSADLTGDPIYDVAIAA